MNKSKKITIWLIVFVLLTPILFTAIAQLLDIYQIQNSGRISYNYTNPYAKLHIGDVNLEESPSFFYDETGKLVTLRMYQSGHRDSGFYLNQIPSGQYTGNTWAESD